MVPVKYLYEGGKSRSSSTGKTSTITLNQGDNDIRITVKSESGKTTNVYTFKKQYVVKALITAQIFLS